MRVNVKQTGSLIATTTTMREAAAKAKYYSQYKYVVRETEGERERKTCWL